MHQLVELLRTDFFVQMTFVLLVLGMASLIVLAAELGQKFGMHRVWRDIKMARIRENNDGMDLLKHAVINSAEVLNLYRTNGKKIIDQLDSIYSNDANIGHKFNELREEIQGIFEALDSKLEAVGGIKPDLEFWHSFETRLMSQISGSKESIALRAVQLAIEQTKPKKKPNRARKGRK